MLVVVIVVVIMAIVAVILFRAAFGRAGGGGIFFDSASGAQRIAFQARSGEPCENCRSDGMGDGWGPECRSNAAIWDTCY